MCMVNSWYYGDRYYWNYIMSDYADTHFAFRSWWGFVTWFRQFTSALFWGLGGVAWVLSMLPIQALRLMFAQTAGVILGLTLLRAVLQVLLQFGAFFWDTYDGQLSLFNYWKSDYVWGFGYFKDELDTRAWADDYAWIDFYLEAANIGVQMVAYPMLQLGVTEGHRKWKKLEEKEAAMAAKADPAI